LAEHVFETFFTDMGTKWSIWVCKNVAYAKNNTLTE